MNKTTIAFQMQSTYNREPIIVVIDSGIDAAKVREIETAFDTHIERYSEANDGDFCDFDDRLAVEQVLNDMGLSFSFFDADYTITY